MILLFLTVIMSRCDLDLWPLDHKCMYCIACHVFKFSTKFEQNQTIRGWVIDDLANIFAVSNEGNVVHTRSQSWSSVLHGGRPATYVLTMWSSDFEHFSSFWNYRASMPNLGHIHICKYLTRSPIKKMAERVGEMSGSEWSSIIVAQGGMRPLSNPETRVCGHLKPLISLQLLWTMECARHQ